MRKMRAESLAELVTMAMRLELSLPPIGAAHITPPRDGYSMARLTPRSSPLRALAAAS